MRCLAQGHLDTRIELPTSGYQPSSFGIEVPLVFFRRVSREAFVFFWRRCVLARNRRVLPPSAPQRASGPAEWQDGAGRKEK